MSATYNGRECKHFLIIVKVNDGAMMPDSVSSARNCTGGNKVSPMKGMLLNSTYKPAVVGIVSVLPTEGHRHSFIFQ